VEAHLTRYYQAHNAIFGAEKPAMIIRWANIGGWWTDIGFPDLFRAFQVIPAKPPVVLDVSCHRPYGLC
jgi:hypothetical protein